MTAETNRQEIYFPYIQIFLMCTTALVFMLFIIKPLHQFQSDNYGPKVIPVSETKAQTMKKEGRLVTTHLSIYDAPKLDFQNDTFSFKGYVIFTYDPKVIPLELIEKFDIQKGTLTKLNPVVINHTNGMQSAHFAINAKFTMYVNYEDYPLDDHLVSFALINAYAKPDELLYVSSDKEFAIENQFAMSRWKDVGHSIKSGYIEKKFDTGAIRYPATLFEIKYAHAAMRKTTIILLPLFLVFFLAVFSLSLNATEYHANIITIAITGISALMAYRYVIEAISPNVGYFMLSDYLFFLFFFTVFLIFMLSMFIENIPKHILRWIIISLYLWIISMCGYLVLIWL